MDFKKETNKMDSANIEEEKKNCGKDMSQKQYQKTKAVVNHFQSILLAMRLN